MQFALHFQYGGGSVHASEIGRAWQIFKTTSVTNLSAFSNSFLKSKINDIVLMT